MLFALVHSETNAEVESVFNIMNILHTDNMNLYSKYKLWGDSYNKHTLSCSFLHILPQHHSTDHQTPVEHTVIEQTQYSDRRNTEQWASGSITTFLIINTDTNIYIIFY